MRLRRGKGLGVVGRTNHCRLILHMLTTLLDLEQIRIDQTVQEDGTALGEARR